MATADHARDAVGRVHRPAGRQRRAHRRPRRERRGLPHRVVEYPIGNVAGAALFADGYTGTAIAVVDTEREVLLGVTFVGPGVAELLQAATIAVVGEVPIARLWHAVPAYPTINEIWLRLLETYRG